MTTEAALDAQKVALQGDQAIDEPDEVASDLPGISRDTACSIASCRTLAELQDDLRRERERDDTRQPVVEAVEAELADRGAGL